MSLTRATGVSFSITIDGRTYTTATVYSIRHRRHVRRRRALRLARRIRRAKHGWR